MPFWSNAGRGYAQSIPGAAQGAAMGAPFGPVGIGIGGAIGGAKGFFEGYKSKSNDKKQYKTHKKRAKKAARAQMRQDTRSFKHMYPEQLKAQKDTARQNMDLEEEYINRRIPLQNKWQKKQDKLDFKRNMQSLPYQARAARAETKSNIENNRRLRPEIIKNAKEWHKATQPLENQAYKDKLKLTKKYGLPEKIENEKFFKKNLLNEQQQRNLDFQNKQAMRQKRSLDIRDNPLYNKATGALSDLLSNSPEAYERFKAPMMREFNEELAPNIANRFATQGALESSGFQNALGHAAGGVSEKLGALRASLQQSALDKALAYANAPIAGRQQEIGNAQNSAQMGLSTKAFERLYRPAMYANVNGAMQGGGQFNAAAMNPGVGGAGFAARPPSQIPQFQTPNVNISGASSPQIGNYNQPAPSGGGMMGGLGGFMNNFLSGAGQGAGQAAGDIGAAKMKEWMS